MRRSSDTGKISSIAVLPFVNATADANNEYLSDGLTDSLISSLSQLPNMKVMGRSTVFRFKGKEDDPRQVGQTLQVNAVLTGRITQHGDEVSVRTDLVSAADGSEIWGDQYPRKLADISRLQDEITRDISAHLRSRLSGGEQPQTVHAGTTNSQAYRLYLEGRSRWYSRNDENLKKSIGLFQQAIDADPGYALAYCGLADTYNVAPGYRTGIGPQQAHALANAAARKAVELDGSLPEAHAALAMSLVNERKWDDADREFQLALRLDPNRAATHYFYAFTFLLPQKRLDQALEEFQTALSLDPLSPIVTTNYAATLMAAHRYPESLAQFQKALDLEPNFKPAHYKLSQLYAAMGRFGDAVSEYQKDHPLPGSWSPDAKGYGLFVVAGLTEDRNKTGYAAESFIAAGFATAGDRESTFQWLEKAVVSGDDQLANSVRYPMFDAYRSDPRYADIMRRIGLPE